MILRNTASPSRLGVSRLSWNGCFIGTKGYFRRIVTFVLYIICACTLEMQWGFGCAAASGTNCQNDALKGDFTANTVKTGYNLNRTMLGATCANSLALRERFVFISTDVYGVFRLNDLNSNWCELHVRYVVAVWFLGENRNKSIQVTR